MNPFFVAFTSVDGNPTIEPDNCLPRGPFVLHSGGHLRSFSIPIWMKCDALELSTKGLAVVAFLDLLLLIMQLVLFSEYFCGNNPKEFGQLNESIRG
jgi:hypothetical protein